MQPETYLNEVLGLFMLGVLISLFIELILGLEREYDKLKDELGFARIRTFPIVTLLGFVMGHLSEIFTPWFLMVGMASFILFLGFGQIFKDRTEASSAITTKLVLLATFVLGIMVSQELYRDSVATAVILVTLLSLKTTFHTIVENITHQELFAFIKFVIIALLILPFLPNKDYGPNGLLNPLIMPSRQVMNKSTN